MLRNREYTIQGWTNEGPAFTVGRPAAGWRNRQARRAGRKLEVQQGPHDLLGTGAELEPYEPRAAMLVGNKNAELWAFKAGHVYAVDAIVDDGDVVRIAFDARENDRVETFKSGLDLLEWRALDGDELDEYLAEGELEQPTNVSDGAESQEPITALTGAQTEEPVSADDDDAPSEAPDASAPGPDAPTDSDADEQKAAVDDGVGEPGEVHAPVVEPEADVVAPTEEPPAGTPMTEEELARVAELEAKADPDAPNPAPSADDEDEPSEHSFDGTVDQFHELGEALNDEELALYAELDHRKGVREHAAHLLEKRKATVDAAASAAVESDPED